MNDLKINGDGIKKSKKSAHYYMRVIHRYLGYFLAGIMAVYAISGIVLIYRETDFLKREQRIEKKIDPDTHVGNLGKALRIKNLKVTKASTNQPLYWLNTFFGLSLLFFVISSFWMFKPKTKNFRI